MFEHATQELVTLRDWLRFAVSRFQEAGLFFGHGSTEAFDEAAYLCLYSLHLPHDRLDPFLDARLLDGVDVRRRDDVLQDLIVDAAEGVEPRMAVFDVTMIDDVVAPKRVLPFFQIVE